MKTKLLIILAVFVLATPGMVQAFQACGNCQVEPEPDCNSNRGWHVSCCDIDHGYRVHGIAYSDLPKQDFVDALVATCRNISTGNVMVAPTEGSYKTLNRYECEKPELVTGVISNDVSNSDGLDGASVVCTHAKTKYSRVVINTDMNNLGNYGSHVHDLNTEFCGFAYQERQKGTSDRVDCVTAITRPRRK